MQNITKRRLFIDYLKYNLDYKYYILAEQSLRNQHKQNKQKEKQQSFPQKDSVDANAKEKLIRRQNNFFHKNVNPQVLGKDQDETIKKRTITKSIKNENLDNTEKNQFISKNFSNKKLHQTHYQKAKNSKFQTIPSQEFDAQKRIFLKHKRYSSVQQPDEVKLYKANLKRKVQFNQKKLTQQLSPITKRKYSNQKSQSPSILKNKHKKRINRLKSLPNSIFQEQNSGQQISIDVKQDLINKQTKMSLIVKSKYFSILQNLQSKWSKQAFNKKSLQTQGISESKKHKQPLDIKQIYKYSDPYFTPTYSSLFTSFQEKNKTKKGQQILWIRVGQIFPDYQLIVLKQQPDNDIKIKNKTSQTNYCAYHMASIFNSIQNCKSLLNHIFQISNVYNKFGIYILKIFHQNVWKYKIIDDKIPVVLKNKKQQTLSKFNQNGKYIPAFLNIQLLKSNNKKQLLIWPFLLQKAYASIYSSYEALQNGNVLDFAFQICGSPHQQIRLQKNKQNIALIKNSIMQQNCFILSEQQQNLLYSPLLKINKQNDGKKGENTIKMMFFDSKKQFNESVVNVEKLSTFFNKLYFFKFQTFSFQIISVVGRYQKISKAQKSQVSLRKIKIEKTTQCLISICQKDQKQFCNSSILYQYIWNRVILISKEINGNYRWINGQYSNKKTISFKQILYPGEYFLIIMPEWRTIHCHQLNILINSNQMIKIQKIPYGKNCKIIQKSCLDLAQRKGKLHQINTFICSYNYLSKQVGLIIENINNQRMTGAIKIIRSINGLKAKVQLVPVNCQFYELNPQEKKKNKTKYKNTIDVLISKEDSYTVVIKMKGGIDHNFFDVFDFGN